MEYIKSYNLCQIRKDRLQEALDKGLIVPVNGDYLLTRKAMVNYVNAFMWMNGNDSWDGKEFSDKLQERFTSKSEVFNFE